MGGDGNDTLIGGKGTDQHIGGAGDDTIIVGGDQFTDNNREISGELISGGEGTDTLTIKFSQDWEYSYRISEGLLSGIETLEISADGNFGGYQRLYMSSEDWNSFTNITSVTSASFYYAPHVLSRVMERPEFRRCFRG